MALWASFEIPFLYETSLSSIHLMDMTSIIMQGVDEKNRPFLAMRVLYDGDQRIGFIIQKYAHRDDEWEYGVLEQLDVYKMSMEENRFMNSNTINRSNRII